MMAGVLAVAAVLGAIALVVVLFLQRGREGIDLAPRGLLRIYLYLASLAGIVVLSIGIAATLNYGLARVAGDEFVYGGSYGRPYPSPVCPPGAAGCKEPTAEELARQEEQQRQQQERQRNEGLLQGITYTVFGLIFWGAHWSARRGLGETDPGMAGLRRGYLMLGTVVYGVGTIVLVPTGVYQALAFWLLPAPEGVYRQGAETLAGGLVSLVVWLIYLRLVVTEFRRT